MKIKGFIFEGKTDEIDENSIFDILEDIVSALEAKIDNIDIIKSLSRYRRFAYLLKVSINGGKVLLDILFHVEYVKMNRIDIEVRPSKPELEHMSDNEHFYFESIEHLEKLALNFILEMVKKHVKMELLRHEKHDFVSDFENIYKEAFEKYEFKIRSSRKLEEDSNFATKFIIYAIDSRNMEDVTFEVMIYPDNTFRIDLIRNVNDIISRTMYLENYEYNFKKALEIMLYYLREQHELNPPSVYLDVN